MNCGRWDFIFSYIKKFANENIYNSDNGEAVCNYIKEYCPIISDSNNFEIEFVSKGIKQSKGALILCKSCDEVFYTSQAARDELKIKEKNQLLRNKHGKKPTIFLSNTYTNDIAKYLDTYANNPNSIKDLNCDDPYIDESGWNTYCTYRMENKFGGIQLYKSHFITSSDVTLCGFNCEQFGY